MDRNAIGARLLQIVNHETDQDLTEVGEEVSLRDGLGLDSLDVTSVLIRLEEHYQLQLTRPELKDVETVCQLIRPDRVEAEPRCLPAGGLIRQGSPLAA